MTNKQLINLLAKQEFLAKEQWIRLIDSYTEDDLLHAKKLAQKAARASFGDYIFVRGLIEFSNYCQNDCFYCGIRFSNRQVKRYRLSKEEIIACCKIGYALGFRTFVLQSGEDLYYDEDKIAEIVREIKANHPDCAVTLSLGEKSQEAYQAFRAAGADRYLLRHETANSLHYAKLHPASMKLEERINCLYDLKEIGYQVGCGFMVGTPGQNSEHLAEDLLFIKKLEPQMVGIGPFLPHSSTPFKSQPAGSLKLTLFLLSLIRLMCKDVLLPATTALGTIHPYGREMGIEAGANVLMPNLSPTAVRGDYLLYDNKICTGDEAAECRGCLEQRMAGIGYKLATTRGDWQPRVQKEHEYGL